MLDVAGVHQLFNTCSCSQRINSLEGIRDTHQISKSNLSNTKKSHKSHLVDSLLIIFLLHPSDIGGGSVPDRPRPTKGIMPASPSRREVFSICKLPSSANEKKKYQQNTFSKKNMYPGFSKWKVDIYIRIYRIIYIYTYLFPHNSPNKTWIHQFPMPV